MTAALLGFRRGLGLVAPALAAPGRPAGFAGVCKFILRANMLPKLSCAAAVVICGCAWAPHASPPLDHCAWCKAGRPAWAMEHGRFRQLGRVPPPPQALLTPLLPTPSCPTVCQPLRKSTLRRQAAAEPPPEPARPSSSPQQPPATPSARQQAAPPPPSATRGAQQTGWPSIGTWQGKLLYGGGLLLLAALCFSAGRSLAGYLCPVFFVYILWDPLSECVIRCRCGRASRRAELQDGPCCFFERKCPVSEGCGVGPAPCEHRCPHGGFPCQLLRSCILFPCPQTMGTLPERWPAWAQVSTVQAHGCRLLNSLHPGHAGLPCSAAAHDAY